MLAGNVIVILQTMGIKTGKYCLRKSSEIRTKKPGTDTRVQVSHPGVTKIEREGSMSPGPVQELNCQKERSNQRTSDFVKLCLITGLLLKFG